MAMDLVVYAIVAAVLVFWLRSILGTRDEDGPPSTDDNPFFPRGSAPKSDTPPRRPAPESDKSLDSFIPGLAKGTGATATPIRVTKTTLVSRVRIETPMAEEGLRKIADAEPRFNLDRFMEGAEYAFELIVTSFAKGDKETLRALLTPHVFNDFEGAITARATRGETAETKIEAVRGMDIISATIKDDTAFISVRFTAQEICLIRNAAGMVIAGDPDHATTMIDIWTFGRKIGAQEPTWLLYETRDEKPEAHKTPVPESRM